MRLYIKISHHLQSHLPPPPSQPPSITCLAWVSTGNFHYPPRRPGENSPPNSGPSSSRSGVPSPSPPCSAGELGRLTAKPASTTTTGISRRCTWRSPTPSPCRRVRRRTTRPWRCRRTTPPQTIVRTCSWELLLLHLHKWWRRSVGWICGLRCS